MLERTPTRGLARLETVDLSGAALGVGRRPWEFSEAFSGPVAVVREEHISVVADASLYYRSDLLARLGPERPKGGSPSHMIAAAYRRWGTELARHLEGDFAFVLWDSREHRMVAARDFSGARPLFFAAGQDWIALASDVRGLREIPGVGLALDERMLAATCGALMSSAGPETCYRDIRWVGAGETLTWTAQRGVRTERHWSPPRWSRGTQSLVEAGEQLRELLVDATRERMSPHGVTGVSLSGGWDSPAVFGAARESLKRGDTPGRVVPVSISYPPGDPGREDELIQQIVDHWDSDVRWMPSDEIPLLAQAAKTAAERPLPWAHMYEHWNRALARCVREADGRVLLSGYGGDQLFQVSDIYLADLVWTLRWHRAYTEWRAKGGRGFKSFFRWAIQPGMGPGLMGLATWLRRGTPLAGYMKRPIPEWIDADLVARSQLPEIERGHEPTRALRSRSEAEAHWYLTQPLFPQVNAEVCRFALEADVELRSPLYDGRIVAFAATRPLQERSWGKETKRLLREASRGLVPDPVLAPRSERTGTPVGYAERALKKELPQLMEGVRAEPFRLAEMGVVRPDILERQCAQLLRTGNPNASVPLLLTLHTELWLRAQHTSPPHPTSSERIGAHG